MKFWMSGRIDHDIDDVFFRTVLLDVEKSVNTMIQDADYGPSIESWDVIVVIYRDPFQSSFRYNSRSRETDIEVAIDHKMFKEATLKEAKRLFFDALILSLEKLTNNKKIKEFSFRTLISDVLRLKEVETT